jgi:ribosomal protein L29
MKNKTNFTEKNDSQLMELLAQKREELRKLRFEAAGARTKDTSSAKKLRADVARILTVSGNRRKEGLVTVVA